MSSVEDLAYRRFEQIRRSGKLPTFSIAGMSLLRMRRRNEASAASVASTLRQDARLSTLSLQLAHGILDEATPLPKTAAELVRSVDPVSVRDGALALSLAACNRVGICDALDYDRFWSRSLARAASAKHLANQLAGFDPLSSFGHALLAEMGVLTLASAWPEEYARILREAEGEPASTRRALELEAFGVDSVQLSGAFLRYLGFGTDVCGAVDTRTVVDPECGAGEDEPADDPTPSELFRAADCIAELLVAKPVERSRLWFELVPLRHRLGMGRDDFHQLGDAISNRWWEWGDQLRIPTEHVPSFAELASQAIAHEQRTAAGKENDDEVAPTPESGRLDVLVVDDDPVTLRLITAHLVTDGHEVRTAKNGKEALIAAIEDTPDLLVADWMMPEMDGLELCRALRRFQDGRRIFFVLVTGREEEERIIEAFDAGVDDFIAKPLGRGLFLARLRAAQRMIALQEELSSKDRLHRRELAKSKLLRHQLDMAALTDMLTDLPNRRYAIMRLEEEWASSDRSGKPLSVVMIDIDHFKHVNDSHGHDAGDSVLRETALTIERTTRMGEAACRLGGEEFLVICSGSDLDAAERCAERIRSAIEQTHVEEGSFSGSVTISAGVAERSAGVRDIDHLLKLADEATYEAKHGGRNRVVRSDPPMDIEPGGVKKAS